LTDEEKQEEFNRQADSWAGDCLSWGCFFGLFSATSALAVLVPFLVVAGLKNGAS
jgi:hypothetical protein